MMMYKQISTIAASLLLLNSAAQTKLMTERLDNLSKQLIEKKEVAGINILLIKDGTTVYNKALGYADLESKKLLTTDHIFRIASQTKAITSVAVMMLWEEGRLLLDDPISKYIPAFKAPQVLDGFNAADSSYTTIPALREITIRDLLSHSSGIAYPTITEDDRIQAIYTKNNVLSGIGNKAILKEQVDKLAKMPLLHSPGYRFTYGLNTDVLGYLIEVISGNSLDDFLLKRIFAPLEMHDTHFRLPSSKADRLVSVSKKTTHGIEKMGSAIYENNSINYPLATGIILSGGAGLSSTTADYAKFLQMLLNKGNYKGKRLLGEKTIALMTTNQLSKEAIAHGDPNFYFGLGFWLVTPENKFMHATDTGTFFWGGAFNTHYWVDPQENMIGLIFTQEYLPASYWDLGTLYKNVIYSSF
jgi:Beta-lactamase class C and other penicillin binding proteins